MRAPQLRNRRPAYPAFARLAFSLVLTACADGKPAGRDPGLPDGAAPDVVAKADTTADLVATDSAPIIDAAAAPEVAVDAPPTDSGPANTPPEWQPLASLALDQGTTAQLDLNPALFDVQDDDAAVTVTWSAQHVGLQDKDKSHQLFVAAPTTWSGSETVTLVATDSGGLTAKATLAITVNPVDAPPLKPNSACAPLVFAIDAGKSAKSVLLSGTFNNWGNTAGNADPMLDGDGDGTWTTDKKLAAGVYQYKFVVDGKWMADKTNPNQVPDGFGGSNSVIEVAPCTP